MLETKNFLHNGSIGDVWASLPSIKEFHRKTGNKVVLLLEKDRKAYYYDNATHPTVDNTGTMVMLNDKVISMMIPLLKAQPYIEDARVWDKEEILVNLSRIRDEDVFANLPYHSLSRWYHYVYPDLASDLSKKYIEVPDADVDYAIDKIIVTRSERYQNPKISYYFLKRYEKDLLFCGTEIEYQIFKLRYELPDLKRLHIKNFLELAQALKQCKFHISNQTQAFQISEGMKTPRIVELCHFAPNVEPIGDKAYEFYNQVGLQYYVEILNGEATKKTNNGFPLPPPINL